VLSGSLLIATFAAAPVNTSFAHPLSGDAGLDQTMVTTSRFRASWPTLGSHLHFEVRQDGQLRDPLDFMSETALKPAAW
jgi:hypothetical protein